MILPPSINGPPASASTFHIVHSPSFSSPLALLISPLYFTTVMRTLLLLLLACSLLAGCQRDIGDIYPPTVTFLDPKEESVFSSGGTVLIKAAVFDDVQIIRVRLTVTNVNINKPVITFETRPRSTTYELNQQFVTARRTRYEIAIEAEDLDGNIHVEKIYVSSLY